MTWLWSPLFVPLLIGAIACFIIAIHVWRRDTQLSISGTFMLITAGFWILGAAFEVLGGDLETKLLATKLQYIGICFVAPVWLTLSIQFYGREEWLTLPSVGFIFLAPLGTFILVLTNDLHGLIWADAWLVPDNPFVWKLKGVGFQVLLGYSYLLVGVGIALTALKVVRTGRFYRWQAIVFLIVILVPVITHAAIDNLGYSPDLEIELTPFVLAIVVPAMTLGLVRWIEDSVVPVARNAVVENMRDGVIVLDNRGRIVDTNPAARALISHDKGDIIGEQLDEVSFEMAQLAEGDSFVQEMDIEISVDGYLRTFNSELSPLLGHQGQLMSRILVLRDITERVQAERKIRDSLQEKEALLREVHHRVKNNLQIITSMLNLQLTNVDNEQVISEITGSQNRILSMAFVHEQLYKSENLGLVDFGGYVNTLINYLFDVYRADSINIGVELNLDDVVLDIDSAIPCGLIINELITNVFKHAFPNMDSGRIGLRLWEEPGDEVHMMVCDNGVGFPSDFNAQDTSSLGYQLIYSLVMQLEGQIAFKNSHGVSVEISFQHPQE